MNQTQQKGTRVAKAALLFLVLAVLLGAFLWWLMRRSIASSPRIRNVLLISIDTCRSDYLSCYGYKDQTTPHIDAVAAEGFLFDNAISPTPLTLPAHCTLLTGTNPLYHAVHNNSHYRLGDSHVTLAEILKDNGFATGAVVGAIVLDSRYGLHQGFDDYYDRFDELDFELRIAERRGEEVNHDAFEWLEQHRDDRFFLFLHYYDPHAPYDPPAPFAEKYQDELYVGDIAYTDDCIGKIVAKLKALDLYDSTLIIITSDHGEMLGEHGEKTHGFLIYQSVVRVPLIFKLPGTTESRRVKELVGLIDIVPTVCDLIGAKIPAAVKGRNVLANRQGGSDPDEGREIYCESFIPSFYQASPLLGLVTPDWKYIHAKRPELYNVTEDPNESRNLAEEQAERTLDMKKRLELIVNDEHRQSHPQTTTGENVQKLQGLGYVGGATAPNDSGFDLDLVHEHDDPKDVLEYHQGIIQVMSLRGEKRYSEAITFCQDMLRHHPGIVRAHTHLAGIAVDQGDETAAIKHYKDALRIHEEQPGVHSNLAFLLHSEGQFQEALNHSRRAIELDPYFSEALFNMGLCLQSLEKLDEAQEFYRRSLQVNPRNADAIVNLAVILAGHGMISDAIEHLRKALQIKPDSAKAHWYLGKVVALQGKLEEAIGQYHQALRIEPEHIEAHNSLADALEAQGKRDEAIRHYRKILEIENDHVTAHYRLAFSLDAQHKYKEAIGHYRAALRIKSDHIEALNNLAWLLATCPEDALREPTEALELAQRASGSLQDNNPALLDTLATAYAAAGHFDLAVATAEKAVELATAAQADAMVREIREHLDQFKQDKPYRASPVEQGTVEP